VVHRYSRRDALKLVSAFGAVIGASSIGACGDVAEEPTAPHLDPVPLEPRPGREPLPPEGRLRLGGLKSVSGSTQPFNALEQQLIYSRLVAVDPRTATIHGDLAAEIEVVDPLEVASGSGRRSSSIRTRIHLHFRSRLTQCVGPFACLRPMAMRCSATSSSRWRFLMRGTWCCGCVGRSHSCSSSWQPPKPRSVRRNATRTFENRSAAVCSFPRERTPLDTSCLAIHCTTRSDIRGCNRSTSSTSMMRENSTAPSARCGSMFGSTWTPRA